MHKRPLGIYLLAGLLMLVGWVWLLAAIVLPRWGVALVPWYVYLGAAAYFLSIGWGLWRGRRWAYVAALFMCVVLAYYLVQTAVVLQRNVLLPFALVVAIFAYLCRARVRAAFSQRPPPSAHHLPLSQVEEGDEGSQRPDARGETTDPRKGAGGGE
jgi:hypothetical protein